MTFTKEELDRFLEIHEEIENKAEEIFNKKYELKRGKHTGKGGVYVERVDFDEGNITVVAEISYCGCCPGDTEYWNIDPKYLFMDDEVLEKSLTEDVRLELEREEEYKRLKEEEKRKNTISIPLSVNYVGKLKPSFREEDEIFDFPMNESEEKDKLKELIGKYPDLALESLEGNKGK